MKHCFSKLLREGYTFLFETNSAGAAFYWCNVTEVTNRENGHRYICCNPKIMAIMHLTAEEFRNKVFDYQNEQEWKYKGNLPAIIDFYADWCGPCKMVAPVLEELANEFEDKLVIYKVNTEKEQDLAIVFGIQSIPTFLFIPVHGDPRMQSGAFPKKVFQQVIEERLIGK